MEKKGNILMKKYDFGKLLGQGNFAKVYHGRDLKSGQSVAIKVIDKEKVSKVGMVDQTKREISAMGLVKHPNIVQLHEVMATKTKIYLVLEYAKGGELFDKVAANGRLEEAAARKYFQQLIRTVDFCHRHGVYHRDLKPENLLLDENENLKVTDFGLSALASCTRQDGLLHTTCGTPAYVAPEVLTRKGYDGAKADVWSCGVILYVLLAGYLPFNDSNVVQMYRKMTKSDFKCPNWFPPETCKLLKRILDPNPDSRISTKKIMANSWFRKGLITKNTMEKQTIHETPFEPEKPDFTKVSSFNAFDIISLSTGFDLSGLFVENGEKDVVKFTSTKPADAIVSKMEEIAGRLKMEVSMKKGGQMRLVRTGVGRIGNFAIDIEVFEITLEFYFVEVRKSCGDALVYREMLKREIRPALEEIVSAWHGEE